MTCHLWYLILFTLVQRSNRQQVLAVKCKKFSGRHANGTSSGREIANEIRHYTVHVDIRVGLEGSTNGIVTYNDPTEPKNIQHMVYLAILYNKSELSMCLFCWYVFFFITMFINNFNQAKISNYRHKNVWDKINCPFQIYNVCTTHTL